MKRLTLFLVLALLASALSAASPPSAQPSPQASIVTVAAFLPGLDGLTSLVVELVWHVLDAPPIALDPVTSTTANDGGGWVPNPPLPPPPPQRP